MTHKHLSERPHNTDRRDVLLGGLLLAAAAATFALMPRRRAITYHGTDLAGIIPAAIGGWSAIDDQGFTMPPDAEQLAVAAYEQQLTRAYINGNSPVIMLAMAYNHIQGGMLPVHRPEFCYQGSGFEIADMRNVDIGLAPGRRVRARFFAANRQGRQEKVLYWTRLGTEFPRTSNEEREELVMQNLRGLVPDRALVRLSTIVNDDDVAVNGLTGFARLLYSASGREARALQAGSMV